MYALVDEGGELTLPQQDKNRRELVPDNKNKARLRSEALVNVTHKDGKETLSDVPAMASRAVGRG
eukprot:4667762-Pleurochrysis_carterae.AAC.1